MANSRYKISNFKYANNTPKISDSGHTENQSNPDLAGGGVPKGKSKIDFTDPKFSVGAIAKTVGGKRRNPEVPFNDEDIYKNAKRKIEAERSTNQAALGFTTAREKFKEELKNRKPRERSHEAEDKFDQYRQNQKSSYSGWKKSNHSPVKP